MRDALLQMRVSAWLVSRKIRLWDGLALNPWDPSQVLHCTAPSHCKVMFQYLKTQEGLPEASRSAIGKCVIPQFPSLAKEEKGLETSLRYSLKSLVTSSARGKNDLELTSIDLTLDLLCAVGKCGFCLSPDTTDKFFGIQKKIEIRWLESSTCSG